MIQLLCQLLQILHGIGGGSDKLIIMTTTVRPYTLSTLVYVHS